MSKEEYRLAWQAMRAMMRFWFELKQAEAEEHEEWALGSYTMYREARDSFFYDCRNEESLIPHFYEAYEQRQPQSRKSTPLYLQGGNQNSPAKQNDENL